jgi:hypothetical protein
MRLVAERTESWALVCEGRWQAHQATEAANLIVDLVTRELHRPVATLAPFDVVVDGCLASQAAADEARPAGAVSWVATLNHDLLLEAAFDARDVDFGRIASSPDGRDY